MNSGYDANWVRVEFIIYGEVRNNGGIEPFIVPTTGSHSSRLKTPVFEDEAPNSIAVVPRWDTSPDPLQGTLLICNRN